MHLLIIDAMNLIRRMYAAMPDHENKETACQSRCVSVVADNAKKLDATHCVVVFEDRSETWRHRLWPAYKAGRDPVPEALADSISGFHKAFSDAGIFCFSMGGWEADDLMAAIAEKASFSGLNVTLQSTDKGFFQLVNERIRVLNHFDRQYFSREEVVARYSVGPEKLCDLWGMTGDSTNNLPGVQGIGIKTATALLQEYGDLDTLLVRFSEESSELKPSVRQALAEHWQSALLSRKLATLVRDIPLGINLGQMRFQQSQ